MEALSRPFEDIAIGDAFLTEGRTIQETDVLSFASLTGDAHPLHTDPEWAAASMFGQRTAHGLLIVSYAAGMVPLDPSFAVALRGIKRVVFKRPAFIGDTIRVKGEIVSTQPLDDGHGLIECRWTIVNQHEKVVARALIEVVWACRAGGAGPADDSTDDAPTVLA